MSFLARTYIVLAQKRITLSYLKEMSYPRAKGFGEKTEKSDKSSSSKMDYYFFKSCGGQASLAVPFLRLPPFKC